MNNTQSPSSTSETPRPDESTTTFQRHDPTTPVLGLRKLPGGPRFPFNRYRGGGRPKSTLLVGSGERCDIILRDRRISDVHCLIDLHETHIILRDCSKNGTFINGIPITRATLRPGYLITVGSTSLLAYNEDSDSPELIIPAATLDQFVHNATDLYGSIHRAAAAIGVPYSTLQGWLKRPRSAAARRADDSIEGSTPRDADPPCNGARFLAIDPGDEKSAP